MKLLPILFSLLFHGAQTSDPNALLQHGLLALQHGELQEARTDLEQASKLDENNAYVWTSLADVYFRLHQTSEAEAAAARAEKAGAGNPVISHSLAMFYAKTGDLERAGDFEAQYAESGKADVHASARTAELYVNGGAPQKALPFAKKAVEQNDNAATEDLLGRALMGNGAPKDAGECFKKAWTTEPNNAQIAFDYADFLVHSQDFASAAQVVDKALETNAGDARLTLASGVARYGLRRFDDAISLFLKTISIDPNLAQPYEFLGRVLDQAGNQLPQILNAFEAHAKAQGNDAEAQLLLAKALLVHDSRSQRAEQLLRKSIALNSNNWEAFYELGVLLETQRNFKGAATELERSIQLNGKEPMPHYHLARVYDRLGEPEKAQAEREAHERLTGSGTKP